MTSFEVRSGSVCISDPCYERGTLCGQYDKVAKNGTWFAEKVNGKLIAHHENFGADYERLYDRCALDYVDDLGVDSGQCGIFCSSIYPDDHRGEAFNEDNFYGRCCNRSESLEPVDKCGVCSYTEYGDGSYPLYVYMNGDEIVAILIDFDPDDEGDDYDEDFEDDE